jgi:hypothetical protein
MNKIVKFAMAAVMLFAVNMNADAQFGGLKKLANKAKEAVSTGEVPGTEDVTNVSNPTTSTSSEGSFMSPIVVENNGAKASGGLDKYIGMTEADEALVYSYYQPGTSDFRTGGKYDCGKTYGNMIAQRIVDMYRMIKSNGKMDLASCSPENLRDFFYGKPKGTAVVTGRPDLNDWLEHAQNPRSKYSSLRKGEQDVVMSKADAAAFQRAAEKAKQAYEAKFGAIPQS